MKLFVFILCVFVKTSYGFYMNNSISKLSVPKCSLSGNPPDPQSHCCGVDSTVTSRIVGGEETALRQYPWLALIEYRVKGYNYIATQCGGSLISGKYVLSAAHCVTGDILQYSTPVSVRLGDYDKSHTGPDCVSAPGGGKDCNSGAISIPIETIIRHPEFSARTISNDVALIRLRQMAPYTDFIRPICLPSSDITLNPPSNVRLYAAGWGIMKHIKKPTGELENIGSNVKRHVDLPLWTTGNCQKKWGNLVGKKQICAGGEMGKDVCMGDSGGPLMNANGEVFEIVGIVSFGAGAPCGKDGFPGVYTKVYAYDSWIRNQIRP